ncbi:MAG: hypothetical protein QM685_26995, partial [Paraburkholderia sp.]
APIPPAAPAWARAAAPIRVGPGSAPTAPIVFASTASTQPAQPPQSPSILGRLFAPTSSAPAASAQESTPLQSVFDRLRGTPARGAAAPAGASGSATPRAFHSWLTNGPRRS